MSFGRRTLLSFPLALAATRSVRAQADPVKVGVIGPLSGPFSLFGRNFRIGIDAWMASRGSAIAGRRIEFVYRDLEAANPAQAKALAQELIVKDKVQYLAGVVFTPDAMAIAPLVDQAKVPFLIFNATGSAITARSPYIVRTSFTLPQVVTPLGPAAARLGSTRIGIAVSDYAPGAEAESAFRKSFEAAGGRVVRAVRMPMRTTDFGPILQGLAGDGIDGVFCFLPAGPPCVAFARAFIDNGLRQRSVKLFTTGDLTQEPDLPALGEAGLGIVSAFHYAVSHHSAENRAFLEAAQAAGASLDEVTFPAVAAFDGMRLLQRMVEATGGQPDAAAAMAAVAGHAWTSPRGPVRLDPVSRHIRQTVYIREVTRDPAGRLINRELEGIGDQADPGFGASAG